ncbi:hypothetical protein OG413_34825 [Streptomyces sp. NBC_01433]|uniref:hypothetical protein n=1 Tax=Streptomyces sp. NBC_01433 TaxID=2903864 RepID=UPI0022507E57|nr:hypothetical protein [Streptomyces sp. NBC_01433]MCX4680393.1 hypothetical protein [Streptomyces sp. NBC_01433]
MESVPVRCPACGRGHAYVTPAYPCPCGAPTAPPLLRGAPAEPITHRTWDDDWVTVRCAGCGRLDQWPHPELCCPCGTVLRVPVRPVTDARTDTPAPGTDAAAHPDRTEAVGPSHIPLPRTAAHPRPSFHPMAIRTGRDAVRAAALYLEWLGYREITQTPKRPASGIDLRAAGVVAQVDVGTRPATPRDVECLWLNALSASAAGVFFSMAGYTEDAGARADGLGIPLFVLDPTGTPQPVNSPADELISTGA